MSYPTHCTTDIRLPHASIGYLNGLFERDESTIELVVDKFHKAAEAAGSDATLCIHTATARVLVSELKKTHPYEDWLEEAIEEVGKEHQFPATRGYRLNWMNRKRTERVELEKRYTSYEAALAARTEALQEPLDMRLDDKTQDELRAGFVFAARARW